MYALREKTLRAIAVLGGLQPSWRHFSLSPLFRIDRWSECKASSRKECRFWCFLRVYIQTYFTHVIPPTQLIVSSKPAIVPCVNIGQNLRRGSEPRPYPGESSLRKSASLQNRPTIVLENPRMSNNLCSCYSRPLISWGNYCSGCIAVDISGVLWLSIDVRPKTNIEKTATKYVLVCFICRKIPWTLS